MRKFFRLFKIFKKNKKKDDTFLIQEDIQKVDEILYKKEKYLKKISCLDRKIILIQKSSQTTIPQLRPLHDTLRQRYKWYYNWHLQPYAKTFHILVFLLYAFALGFSLNYLIKPVTKVMAVTTGFPRWEWQNPNPTGANLNSIYAYNSNMSWAVGDAGTIIETTNGGTNWTLEYPIVSNNLNYVLGGNPSNVWAVGDAGKILKYNGVSWSSESSGTTYNLNKISVVNSDVVWVAGDAGIVLRTINSGENWTVFDVNNTTDFLGVAGVSADVAWAVGLGGVIYKTTNGGSDWLPQDSDTSSDLYDIKTLSASEAWVVAGNELLKTSDGGTNWNISSLAYCIDLTSLSLIDSNNAWAVNSCSANVTETNDGGLNWNDSVLRINSGNLFSLSVEDVWVVGDGGFISKTTNEGDDWNNQSSGTLNDILSIDSAGSDVGWVVGKFGEDNNLYMNNGGQNWDLKMGGGMFVQFSNISAVGRNTAWTTAFNNGTGEENIYLTTNSGDDWTVITDETGGPFNSVAGLSDTVAFAARSSIYKFEATGDYPTRTISMIKVIDPIEGDIWRGNKIDTSDDGNIWVVGSIKIDGVWTPKIMKSTDDGASFLATDQTSANILDLSAVSSDIAWISSYNGLIKKTTDGGSDWQSVDPSGFGDKNIIEISAISDQIAFALSDDGYVLKTTNGGITWSSQKLNTAVYGLRDISAGYDGSGNIYAWVGGNGGTILKYYAPVNATATKLLVKLPGQDFASGVGLTGTPTSVRVGESVEAKVYAVDDSNILDRGYKYEVGFSSTDPSDENPGGIVLDNGSSDACDAESRVDDPCGVGTVNFVFHREGNWTVTGFDPNFVLSFGISSQITVTPGPASLSAFENFPSSLAAGTPSGAITIQVKDLYGNDTTVSSDTTVSLKTNSSSGRFSTNRSTWVSGEKNVTIPAGSGSVTFYYLDLATGSQIITAKVGNLSSISSQINITAGELSNSTLTLNRDTIRAGESLTAQVNLKNSQGVILSGRTVRLSSSREFDSVGGDQITDASGNANFNVSSTRVGSFDLIIYNASDDLYATAVQTVKVTPGDLSTAVLSKNSSKITAGESINLTTTLLDKFGNTLDNLNSLISFSSSDTKAEFDQSNYWFKDSGTYSQSVILKTSGTQKIEALKSGSVLGSTTINIDPTSVSVDASTVLSDKDRIDPESGIATITVKLMDTFGNSISGKNVSITSSRSEDNIEPLSVTTGDDGQANFSFSSSVQGDSIIVAQDITDNLILTKKLKIRVAPANILDKIKESPVAKALTNILAPVSKALALIGLVPLILQILQAIPSAAPLASSVFPALFTTASVRRRKKPWGNVFDSLTGHPVDLAVVRLYEKSTGKLVSTQVTDFDGRFHFLTSTGTYYIQVKKKGYEFPAKISEFKASQLSSRFGKDSDIYLGVPFTIKNKNAQINLNIPMDPILEKLTNNIKFKKTIKEGFEWFLIGISYIAFPLMLIGAAISALSTVVISSRVNFITDGVYFVLLLGFLVTSRIRQNRLGQVFDSENKKPISGAMVTVFDQEYNAIRQTQATDKNGNFSILAQKGAYYIIIEKDGYKFPSTKIESTKKQPIYTGGIIDKAKTGFIGVDIPMDKN